MKRRQISFLLFNSVGILIACLCLFPLFWMMLAGFKKEAEVLAMPFKFFPNQWDPINYTNLLTGNVDTWVFAQGVTFWGSIMITFQVAVFSLVCSLLVNSMAGYVFARLDFPFKKLLWGLYLIPWFVPGISVQISTFASVLRMNLLDTFWVLTLPGICFTFSIFFFRQFYLNIPSSLEEAALLDGATRLNMYYHIFLPMSATPFVVMGISVFLGYWGSYLWPAMTITNPKLFQINQVIAYFRSSRANQQHLIMAASTIAAIPTILLFFLTQKYIMSGIKVSGLK